MKRVDRGSAAFFNPFGGKLHEVSLLQEDVTAFVFWTKNAKPFLPSLEKLLLSGYKAFFQFTLTGYGPPIEGCVPPWRRALTGFKELSNMLGPEFVRWRYDPILITGKMDHAFHLKNFSNLAACLEGATTVCHVSFVQLYKKSMRNFEILKSLSGVSVRDPSDEEKTNLAGELAKIAGSRGIRMVSCCYHILENAGIEHGCCVDPELVRRLRPDLSPLHLKTSPTRNDCLCAESRDIGAYDTCPGACVYCYATQNRETAKRNFEKHDRDSLTLV